MPAEVVTYISPLVSVGDDTQTTQSDLYEREVGTQSYQRLFTIWYQATTIHIDREAINLENCPYLIVIKVSGTSNDSSPKQNILLIFGTTIGVDDKVIAFSGLKVGGGRYFNYHSETLLTAYTPDSEVCVSTENGRLSFSTKYGVIRISKRKTDRLYVDYIPDYIELLDKIKLPWGEEPKHLGRTLIIGGHYRPDRPKKILISGAYRRGMHGWLVVDPDSHTTQIRTRISDRWIARRKMGNA